VISLASSICNRWWRCIKTFIENPTWIGWTNWSFATLAMSRYGAIEGSVRISLFGLRLIVMSNMHLSRISCKMCTRISHSLWTMCLCRRNLPWNLGYFIWSWYRTDCVLSYKQLLTHWKQEKRSHGHLFADESTANLYLSVAPTLHFMDLQGNQEKGQFWMQLKCHFLINKSLSGTSCLVGKVTQVENILLYHTSKLLFCQ